MITSDPRTWTKIYDRKHAPSTRSFVDLDLTPASVEADASSKQDSQAGCAKAAAKTISLQYEEEEEDHQGQFSSARDRSQTHQSHRPLVPTLVKIHPGQVRGLYVHSSRSGDEAIVYDNHYGTMNPADTPKDDILQIHPALAHVSTKPFGRVSIWGWGEPWRHDRKFVGRVNYGIVYKLWSPSNHLESFGPKFRHAVRLLFMMQRRWETPTWSRLPDEVICYVLHLCKWDWFGDTTDDMKREEARRKKEKKIQEAKLAIEALEAANAAANLKKEEEEDGKPSAKDETMSREEDSDDSDDGISLDDSEEEQEQEWDSDASSSNEDDDSSWDIQDDHDDRRSFYSHGAILYNPDDHRSDDEGQDDDGMTEEDHGHDTRFASTRRGGADRARRFIAHGVQMFGGLHLPLRHY